MNALETQDRGRNVSKFWLNYMSDKNAACI